MQKKNRTGELKKKLIKKLCKPHSRLWLLTRDRFRHKNLIYDELINGLSRSMVNIQWYKWIEKIDND